MQKYETLALERVGEHVLIVTLNRPEVLNAINTRMGEETLDLWVRLSADPGEVRCVVLTGAGERAFCAGGDLKERDGMTDEAWRAQHEIFERSFIALMECTVPVIAAVNGHAYGGGLETALCCDFIYAARGARFALSEVRLGIMPGGGGTQNLARAAGERRAKELILSARAFSAEEAHEWGIVNRVCEPVELRSEAIAAAGSIAENAPLSVRQAKKSIHYGLQTDLLTGYRFEIEAYNRLVTTEDRHEGVRAFNEKRKPAFRGR
ncbi:MAG: enoyl-CoA hydratase [Betaproteobacteria bacterium RBG_16_64_18]|nr:MAG: enoyl-CoA hydratase [Betaproteobacteria bacterium RBG_16_64_18]OGA14604.1 MAG: enoyl-CoA hydratase [Betaproteobacteria bacterium RIFCSPLOWO2_02_FULL_65_20]OGA37389.1 MAG: enoyl-CoA hydratase [Betaproteobacteria bacterium RIFCSPLOWO2_12_FULL_65_110]